MVRERLSETDHEAIRAAVREAEAKSDGEIVTIIAPRSDAYHDVGLHYAVLAMLLVPGLLAVVPQGWIDWWIGLLLGWNAEPTRAQLMLFLFAKLAAVFLVVRYALAWMPLRMALTPAATKRRRVRRRAVELFRVTCERRTRGRTGVLLYLSLAEHRAEIVADQAIVEKTQPADWGEAMALLIAEVKMIRAGAGMTLAVTKIGEVLARVLPPDADNPNELPDSVIEL
jgi:putative membrane protein